MQGYVSPRQKSSINIYYSCHHDLVDSYEISRFYLYCFLSSITDNNFTRFDCRTPEFTPIFISPGQCSPQKLLGQMNRQLVRGIPKTLTTLFLKDSTQFLILNGFSFVGGQYLLNLTFLLRLNGCSFQIADVANLKYLDMTGWYCNKVSGHLLSKLFLLETLIASDVHLGDGLKNYSEATYLLQHNLNLKHIDFSYNVISNIPKSLFMHRLSALTELNLSNNTLSTFPSFASEIQLEILDLSFNSITYFSDDEIQTINNMKPFKIYLKGNPLQCLCPSLRFLKWMKQSHIVADVHVLRCAQEDGSNQNIVNIIRYLKSYQSQCLAKFWIPFSVTLSSVLILCKVFTVLYFRYKRVFEYFFLIMKCDVEYTSQAQAAANLMLIFPTAILT